MSGRTKRGRGLTSVEFDGPNVDPSTIDTVAVLRVASDYLRLVQQLAKLEKRTLTVTGLAVVDKCVEMRFSPSDRSLFERLDLEASACVKGDRVPPTGAHDYVKRARHSLGSLPQGYTTKVRHGRRVALLELPVPGEGSPREFLSIRAKVTRVGGVEPAVTFSAPGEANFTLKATTLQAVEAGRNLYKDVELSAQVERGPDGSIAEGGEILGLEWVTETDDPTGRWREWFQPAAARWNRVEDIEGSLGRGDDE